MPTKTDRILSYLPSTFRALPKPTALYSVVDAFGNELLLAENSLAALMLAHWVDHADKGAELIDDLARIAALYGLAPRPEEGVEEFREHLKRYVRTFLEGTVTVQGILRVTAEALGLRIADTYDQMDTWWTRRNDALITTGLRGDDAAKLLLGVEAATVTGQAAQPAQIIGKVDLGGGVDLHGASLLRLKVDTAVPVNVDLTGRIQLEEIKQAINDQVHAAVADHDGHHLLLASPTIGPASRLEVQEIDGDAAPRLLGLLPRTYLGTEATKAQVTGMVDLSGGVDLGEIRYLRLLVDGKHLAEVDCAAHVADPVNPTNVQLEQIKTAINEALGVDVASHDGQHLILTSPTTGFNSSIAFQPAAAQGAKERLFGLVEAFHAGRDPRSAEAVAVNDLSRGIDLSMRSKVRVQVDDKPAVTVDCAGGDPAHTLLSEIVAKLTAQPGSGIASHDGRFVHLASPTTGPTSSIAFESLPAGEDAIEIIFGIGPRTFQGSASTRARLVGAPNLNAGVDLGALHVIQVALDGGPLLQIDVRTGADNMRTAKLVEITAALNAVLGANVASDDGQHLILTSPTTGGASRIAMEPLAITRRRRFVTRAFSIDEAAQASFGFIARQAQGVAATQAFVVGTADLSRGVDLREARFLRLAVDSRPAVDIDCAGTRPRATMIGEMVDAINAKLKKDGLETNVASHDGQHLVLTSPTTGASSRIAFEPPRAADALDKLLGVEPATFRGRAATSVSFVGTVDLSAGVDLPANAAIKLSIDSPGQVEISLVGPEPTHKTLNEIVIAINVKLEKVVAQHDGTHIILTSLLSGENSRIEFAVPGGPDATRAIFGISAPRAYQGANATPAKVKGIKDLAGEPDLSVARFLRIAVNGGQPVDVDCAAFATDPAHTTLDQIKRAINEAIGPQIASDDGKHLILTSTTEGAIARLDLLPYTSGDARAKLLGDVPEVTTGTDPAPAVITGEADLLTPVNLAERRLLRLSVNGDRSVDVDVAGAAPEATFLDEIIARINAVFPGLASATDDDHLQLTSPTAGEGSRLELLPSRALELIEYPPAAIEEPPRPVRHGDHWFVDNDGAADAELQIELGAPQGAVGPELVNRTLGQRIRLMVIIRPGERVELRRDPETGLRAATIAADGTLNPITGAQILAGPLGMQLWAPFDGERQLSDGDAEHPASLQLNNPFAKAIVVLRARKAGPEASPIKVSVTEAKLAGPGGGPVAAEGRPVRLVGRVRADAAGHRLVDVADVMLARLRAGPGVELNVHCNRVVAVRGTLYLQDDGKFLMQVEYIADLFDVTLSSLPSEGAAIREPYTAVTIGLGAEAADGLTWQINVGPQPSQLVKAEELDKAGALMLPVGRSEWVYLDCYGARFDRDYFNAARFAGGLCYERGVFNVSRFASRLESTPQGPEVAVFAPVGPLSEPPVEIRFQWSRYRPGAFIVNLPADLPEQFGGRFHQARFAKGGDKPEEFKGVVTEPITDPDYLVTRLASSTLVKAKSVDRKPIGFEAATMPFRRPRSLTGGTESEPARLYLAEKDVPGFIELSAEHSGAWGNSIQVAARKAGPARFDVTVSYQAARFENARRVALGGDQLPALIEDLLRPGPVGVLQAKAAGVRTDVTRERTESNA